MLRGKHPPLEVKPLTEYCIINIVPCFHVCSVVIWNLQKKEAICGAPAAVPSSGTSYVVAFCNNNDELFVTSGK